MLKKGPWKFGKVVSVGAFVEIVLDSNHLINLKLFVKLHLE